MQTGEEKKYRRFFRMKYKLLLSFTGILLMSIWIVLIVNKGSTATLSAYQSYTNYYQSLSDFYREIETAESSAKAYIYEKSEGNMSDYQKSIDKAREILHALITQTDDKNSKQEYENLENMVETYDSLFQDIIEENLKIQDGYGFFLRIPSLIQDTYIEYAEMVNRNMSAEYHAIARRLERQLSYIGVIICLMVLGAFAGAMVSIYSITKPISKLVENIKKIERKEYHIKEVKSQDPEINTLSHAIVEMAESVQENLYYVEERITLEKLLLQQENENLRMNELLIHTQLKVLQDQMNPHFLFNTLNLITKMAYLEHAPRTSELMEKTADLLRYSLDKSNGSSDLAGEIGCIRNYIEIQKIRFGHRIQFELFVQEKIPNVVMPGMILQPLMENAVSHGVNDMMNGARIRLSVKKIRDEIHMVLEDNGKGMDSWQVDNLLANMKLEEHEKGSKGSGIGIRNVMMRLEMFYGEEGIVDIQSTKNCGTVMTVMIPIAKEEDLCTDL